MDDSNKEEMRYNSDDEARERDGNASDIPHMLDEESNEAAKRDALARQMEDLIADALDWMEMSQSEDARDIYNTLVDVYEQLDNPPEDTDDEARMGEEAL